MQLAVKIKEIRKQKKMSQEELAEKVGINQNHLSRLETGKYKPSIDALKRLADALEVSADYLLSDTDDKPEEIRIEDQILAERIRMLNTLDGKDKETIIHVIDSILTKKKMLSLLQGETV
ncbi:helix-turn-helix transcriptional regulator [Deltaproteobacteria bacterium TL4]